MDSLSRCFYRLARCPNCLPPIPPTRRHLFRKVGRRYQTDGVQFLSKKSSRQGEKGDYTAQYFLGCAFDDGNGVAKNPTESVKWMNLAAQQGMARAQRQLGWAYLNGYGVEADASQAFGWYQKAAQQGDAKSQMSLGWMYEHGSGVPQDYDQAAKFYRLAAEQGHAMAQNNLGWLYKNGWGLPQDGAEALKWFQKSADQGEVLGKENVAWIYAKGAFGSKEVTNYGPGALLRSGGVVPNHELAEKWMREAVDLNSIEGEYKLGNLIYNENVIRVYDGREGRRKSRMRLGSLQPAECC